jgi:hypothetical protein
MDDGQERGNVDPQEDDLRRLASLRASGVLTDAEYEAKRAAVVRGPATIIAKGRPPRRRLVAFMLLLLLACGGGVTAFVLSSSSEEGKPARAETVPRPQPSASVAAPTVADVPTPEGPLPEQRCVDLWNSEDNEPYQRQLQSFGQPLDDSEGTIGFISVGFASDYPDKCLVTASFPARQVAFQYFEGRTASGTTFTGDSIAVDNAASLIDGWNADLDADGYISLK